MPVTRAPVRASGVAYSPVPQPRSATRTPGPTWNVSVSQVRARATKEARYVERSTAGSRWAASIRPARCGSVHSSGVVRSA